MRMPLHVIWRKYLLVAHIIPIFLTGLSIFNPCCRDFATMLHLTILKGVK
jgi:hypothetical protein